MQPPPDSAGDTAAAKRRLWSRAKDVFDAIADLSAGERAGRISAACGGDDELRRAVESLLRSHDALPDTVEDHLATGIGDAIGRLWPEIAPGRRFGTFAVVEEIGRGGMGVVYLADRVDAVVTQRVALKIVAHAALDADASGRLAAERRLLATLEHPNIARLIDAGEDASGVPYFAMEYVSGLPITTYCDRNSLSLAERLRLFRQVCSAVQYAHANLIVHCDLKAGNILVTESGLPKLLDFGIATSLDASLSQNGQERSASIGARFLSPHAAAPEQFLDQPRSIATDVYALGVLLCELTGGGRPFESEGADAGEIQRRVLSDPPRLPSVIATATAAAQRGAASLPALRAILRGDIDAIADKALRKRPRDRYASVAELDADIARHLERRPVGVRRHERGYRVRTFVRRNALPVLLGIALAALLVGFSIVTVLQNRQLAFERDEAQAREREALFEQQRAQQVADFLIGLFQSTSPEQARAPDVSARDLLARGRKQLDTRLREQPALRAALLATISDAYLALDDLDSAQPLADEAARLRDEMHPPAPALQAASLRQLAQLANQRGRHADALALADRALALADRVSAGDRAAILAVKAVALEGIGKPGDAVVLWREALAIETREYGEDDIRRLRTGTRLTYALRAAGMVDEAERLLADNLQRERRVYAADDPILGDTLLDLAILSRNKGERAKAQPLAREALDIFRRVYGETSSRTAAAINTIGTIAQGEGDYASAQASFEQALSIKRSLYGDVSPQVASAEYNVGLFLLLRRHDAVNAEAHLRIANDVASKILPAGNLNLANYRLGLGSALRELGRYSDAESVLRLALSTFETINAPRGIDIAITRGELACIARARSPNGDADAQLDAALATLDRQARDNPQAQRLRDCPRAAATPGRAAAPVIR